MVRDIGKTCIHVGFWEVVESNHPDVIVGDYYSGLSDIQKYWLFDPSEKKFALLRVKKVNKVPNMPLLYSSGPFSLTSGITAYTGIVDIIKPKPGCVAYVSAAAGGVGFYAGQILRILGCSTVIGSTSSDAKNAELLKIGYTHTINYKTENIDEALHLYAPNGLDIYFDNVGGTTLETTIQHMKPKGVVLLCGSASQYDSDVELGKVTLDVMLLILKSIRVEGFLASHYLDTIPQAIKDISEWINDGKMKVKFTVSDGFEKYAEAFVGLYHGINLGKLVVRVDDKIDAEFPDLFKENKVELK